jgi:hypothetical protein
MDGATQQIEVIIDTPASGSRFVRPSNGFKKPKYQRLH